MNQNNNMKKPIDHRIEFVKEFAEWEKRTKKLIKIWRQWRKNGE